ncbi:mycothiol synthase [Kitasatospora sp. NBC_00315]|uniref:mycothiol synthase n=1 Tax=Kitasatospora sp. NBC_00315 TaxID=2975963 RepID=UPI00324B711D
MGAKRSYTRAGSAIDAGAVLEAPDEVQDLLAAAAREDGREAVSEQGRLRLRSDRARPGVVHLVQTGTAAGTPQGEPDGSDGPVGYAQLELAEAGEGGTAGGTAELVVHPGRRGRGFGRQLVDAVLAEAGGPVDFWAHGGHPGARHLAREFGGELVRELRQMRRSGAAVEEVSLPEGVTLRTFRPGLDDARWLRLNALAFAHHPEQGSWTEADLGDRLAEPWFDPNGFFLATRGERVVGYHWTKVHPATADAPALGEVYVVGVDPAEQGGGLGRALTAAGLRHLTGDGPGDRGLETVLLYVDADNPAAVRVYERLGFTIHEVDLVYRVQTGDR